MPEPPPPVAEQVGLRRLNEGDDRQVRESIHDCLAVPRWQDQLLAGRPYATVAALLAAAEAVTATLSEQEVLAAIDAHPRIGERARGAATSARWSASEQSGVTAGAGADDIAARLTEANVEYERRFGHVYLVCATGKDGEQILADLNSRLDNDHRTETAVVRGHLGEIAKLRLRKVLGE